MAGRSHGSHARGTRRRRGCVLLVCASFILAPLWWQRRGDDGEGTRHQTGDSSLLTDLHVVPSVDGGYDGSHQGGAANFVDEHDIGEVTRARVTDRPRTHAVDQAGDGQVSHRHGHGHGHDHNHHHHDHDESSHDHGVPVALAGRPPRDASPTKQKLAELGVIDGWDLDPDTSQTRSSKAITPTRIPFPLGSTTLLPDATDEGHDTHGAGVHLDAYRLNARYLTRVLDPRKLLANFRVVAKLPPETTGGDTEIIVPYCDKASGLSYTEHPGACWEAPDCELRGHFAGHYLSALAFVASDGAGGMMNGGADERSGGELEIKTSYPESITGHQSDAATARHARSMVDTFVSGLAEAQASAATSDGYVSAFPETVLDKQGAIGGAWAPYYTLHKIGQGLLDAHRLTGSALALTVLEGMARNVLNRVTKLIEQKGASHWFKGAMDYPKAAFGAESGGFNELAWRLYELTGSPEYVTLAGLFDHPTFLGQMARNEDKLEREHANFHEPLAMGAWSRWAITGDEESKAAFGNFIGLLRDTRAYATGGTCDGERWQAPGRLERVIVSTETQETCTQVNFERLADAAVASFGESEARDWADYSERASLHGPVGLQRKPGELLYTTPLGVGVSKGRSGHGWGRPDAAFWCCYGTGVEALARLRDGVFWRLPAGSAVPGTDQHADVDTVYVARVTTSASAVWEERGGLTVTVRVAPFGTDPKSGKDQKSRQTTLASVAAISVRSGKGAKSSKPTSIRVKLPRWSSGGSERSTTSCALNGERVRCDDVSAGWCDVRREWRRTDSLRCSFPLVVRAEPLLGSELGSFGTGGNQAGDGKGTRHAIVAGPYVLAALGPAAWVADLGFGVDDFSSPSSDRSGGFHAGSVELSPGDVSALPTTTTCTRVSLVMANGRRYLGSVVSRSDGKLPGDSGGVGPYVKAAAVFTEPLLEPTQGESRPGGSGFFYASNTCDESSCAYAIADAPAVTWHRCRVDSKGGGGGGDEDAIFTLSPVAAPGLGLHAGVVQNGRAALVLQASTGLSGDPLAMKVSDDGRHVAVHGGELDGYVLCRDEASAADSADGCKDMNDGCPKWAAQAACFANQGYMHRNCALSCGLCRPGDAVLMAPEKAETKECGTRVVFGSNNVEGAEPGHRLPWRPPRGSHVGKGPDPRWMPNVLLSPLYSLRDEVYTVYLRLRG